MLLDAPAITGGLNPLVYGPVPEACGTALLLLEPEMRNALDKIPEEAEVVPIDGAGCIV